MKQNILGKTGIAVSELCFGTLPIGPLQADFPVEKAAEVIRYGLEQGITHIDTAQRYDTYPHVRQALEGYSGQVIISSKSWAPSYELMQQAIEEARKALNRDTIDIFLLHAARAGAKVFEERKGALECLCDAKAKGWIRATGMSTHSAKAVRLAADVPEIDIIHPLMNLIGLGILDGDREDMLASIGYAAEKGKGMYLMKIMAGGHLVDRFQGAIDFARTVPGIAAFAVGMLTQAEVDANIAYLEGRELPAYVAALVGKTKKKTYVMDQCKGCGNCEKFCPSDAIHVVDNRAVVDPERCLLCGYCVPHCPQFAIRLISK
ncbi:MAG: aldo/keto reductase [Negativicutes bacterium]|nr:aldo/keto reductase [Negativicutes bacterium]MDR3590724.1 aldo/keto reductase [Negativicutes bacterium]